MEDSMDNSKKQVILCVDDEKKNLELLEVLLEPKGYDLRFSGSGEDALKRAQAELPDLILLDVMMPVMSGFDVLERLRAEERTKLIPVVLLTALNADSDRIRGIDAGCDDFISKPFNKAELIARIRSLLKSSYYRRSLNEKEKFEAVIHEMKDGVVVCRPDWTVTSVNRSAQRLLDLKEGASFLDPVFDRYSVSSGLEILEDLSKAPEKFDIKREATEEFKELCLETHLDILRDPSGKPSSVVLILRDVTKLRNENFIVHDFLGLLSHKFNTPISVVSGVLDLIRLEISKPESLKFLDAAEKKLKEIHEISRRLIYVLEMQSKGLNDILLEDFLQSAVHSTKELLDAKYETTGLLVRDISVQKVALWKVIVLEELMDNAYKFRNKDGLSLKLILTEDFMTLCDNGVGIPPEEREKIFEPFYQVYKNFHGNIPGLGLGLTLVKKLVELNKGGIEVDSTMGEGTKIKINFSPHDGKP